MDKPSDLRAEFDRLRRDSVERAQPDIAALQHFSGQAARSGNAEWIIELLTPIVQKYPQHAALLELMALAHREEQDIGAALGAIDQAMRADNTDLRRSALQAQIHFEAGHIAAPMFKAASQQDPTNLGLLRSLCVAMAAEGDQAGAEHLLTQAVKETPGWIDGHKLLTSLRTTGGADDAERSFAKACAREPQNRALRLAWFHALSQARNWNASRDVIEEGVRLMGDQPGFAVARIFIDSESGEAADDTNLFDAVANLRDPGLDLCHVRHALRGGRLEEAEQIAMRNLGTPAATMFWPYLSLIWRLTGDERAHWLDGAPPYIQHYDLAFSAGELEQLATILRALHTMRAPYLDQSVRGGTQTERPLFLRDDPLIQLARTRVIEAVRAYVADLPAPDPGHPLLNARRDKIRFEGSWSVRLNTQGHHACHTHPMGWISSALYVGLPRPDAMGRPPAGWLQFGTPPPELGLSLHPYAEIEPKPGRLALFPSTMWHSTVPFEDGERLTIAFDVKRLPRFD